MASEVADYNDRLDAPTVPHRPTKPSDEKGVQRLLTTADVAERLQCSERRARTLMHQLAHVRVGKLLRIRPEVLDAWIDAGGDEPIGLYSSPRARAAAKARAPSLRMLCGPSRPELRVPVRKRAKTGE